MLNTNNNKISLSMKAVEESARPDEEGRKAGGAVQLPGIHRHVPRRSVERAEAVTGRFDDRGVLLAAGFWKRLLFATMGEGRPDGQEELPEEEARPLREQGHVRMHYYFSGRVQEVGFRYTAFAISSKLGLTGWVLNLPDGRVEMEVQERRRLSICCCSGSILPAGSPSKSGRAGLPSCAEATGSKCWDEVFLKYGANALPETGLWLYVYLLARSPVSVFRTGFCESAVPPGGNALRR